MNIVKLIVNLTDVCQEGVACGQSNKSKGPLKPRSTIKTNTEVFKTKIGISFLFSIFSLDAAAWFVAGLSRAHFARGSVS